QYGAGTVMIWDRGTYENLLAKKPVPQTVRSGIEAGQLELPLHGRKLKGKFALIRMRGKRQGKENWLLIKMNDEFARPERPDTEPRARNTGSGGSTTRIAASVSSGSRPKPPRQLPRVTHPDKIFYPDAGVTKGDVFAFYRRIARYLLPHLRN